MPVGASLSQLGPAVASSILSFPIPMPVGASWGQLGQFYFELPDSQASRGQLGLVGTSEDIVHKVSSAQYF